MQSSIARANEQLDPRQQRVVQNERTSGFAFKFVVQQRIEIGQNNARNAKKKS